jgi:hypothetical protein
MLKGIRVNQIFAAFVSVCLGGFVMAFEKPSYSTLSKEDGFDVRLYEPYLIAETEVRDEFSRAGNQAFQALFDYIGGNNSSPRLAANEGEKISMTIPVNQIETPNDSYKVSFVLPAKFSLDTAPVPNSSSVTVRELPAMLMASIRYSGNWSQKRYEKKLAELRNSINENERYEISGEPMFARYNPPLVPGLFRRNEILIPILEK